MRSIITLFSIDLKRKQKKNIDKYVSNLIARLRLWVEGKLGEVIR